MNIFPPLDLTVLHWALCGLLFWTAFRRAVKSTRRVRRSVRVGLLLIGLAAAVSAVAPLYGWHPDLFSLITLSLYCVVQVIFTCHWADQVPRGFLMPQGEFPFIERRSKP